MATIGNTLENGLAGNYQIRIRANLKEAWGKTHGFKGIFWGAFTLTALITLIFRLPGQLLMAGDHNGFTVAVASILEIIATYLNLTFIAGLILIAIRNVSQQTNKFSYVFIVWRSGKLLLKFLGLMVLYTAIVMIFAVLFAIPYFLATTQLNLHWLTTSLFTLVTLLAMYISVNLLLAVPLIIERRLGVWRALINSFKAVNKHWFKVFFLWLFFMLLYILAIGLLIIIGASIKEFLQGNTLGNIVFVICLAIAVIINIWLYPMLFNLLAINYREIVGIQEQRL